MNRTRAISSTPTSELSSVPSSQVTFRTASSQVDEGYRQSKEISFELLNYVKFYIEEPLLTTALRILTSITTSRLTSRKDIYVPPPDYLAAISTIAVHPSLTSRTTDKEKHAQAIAALKYLNLINKVVGPVNANFSTAFTFDKYLTLVRSQSSADDAARPSNKLSTVFAVEDNIYNTAEDFWSVVGWALSCSCHPTTSIQFSRWKYWHAWLEFQLSVLDADWLIHTSRNTPQSSMLWSYTRTATGGDARTRRILRAIFADALQRSTNEFREIFRRELKRPRSEAEKQRREDEKTRQARVDVDIEQEIYGDYLDPTSSGTDSNDQLMSVKIEPDMDNGRSAKRRRLRDGASRRRNRHIFAPNEAEDSDTSAASKLDHEPTLGPPEAITLRLRLLQLLANLSTHLDLTSQTSSKQDSPTAFPDTHDLMTLLVENIRPLPLPLFRHFIQPSRALTTTTQTMLIEYLLQRIIDADTPSPSHHNHNSTTLLPRLLKSYLPSTAAKSTVDFQAKTSLLCESLLRSLRGAGQLVASPELVAAVEAGIARRRERVDVIRARKSRKGRESGGAEERAMGVLEGSAGRMRLVVRGLG